MAAEPATDQGDGLPDEAAARRYLAILAEGGRIPVASVTDADRPAIDQLLTIGLVMANPIDAAYLAVSPRSVGDRLGADMRSRAARLLQNADRLPDALAGLARAYDAMPREADQSRPTVYLEGRDRIRHRIAELVSDCKEELLTAQPGPRPPSSLELARPQDSAFVGRGGKLRTIYQPMVLGEPMTVEYAAELTALGAGFRLLDEPYQRMIIVDRRCAVIPAADDHSRAVLLSDPAAVAFLVACFERDWARADLVQWHQVDARQVTRSVSDRVGRLLATGLTQRGVASRLGLSERTVAGHISRLRERYGAQTLFQLGWLMRGSRRD
ncbi:LuxR C-terminal-related transcriptional regulator [Kitasatospora terrestris]|uniref:Helix-turn-helix transcriptional regulator n=1 Tax=Kitasatospora terrestris TaxID=258051 RepID=A0ABP9DQR8_9ACTN